MKNLFRLFAFIIVPATAFLMGTTAYSSDYSLVERDLNSGSQNRTLSSATQSGENNGSIKLNALSPLAGQTTAQDDPQTNPASNLSSATPAYGNGMGVQISVFSFQ